LRVNDKHQAATAGATVRVGVIESLARQSLAARTADRAIALNDQISILPDLMSATSICRSRRSRSRRKVFRLKSCS